MDKKESKLHLPLFNTQKYRYKSLVDAYFDTNENAYIFNQWLVEHFTVTTSRNADDWFFDACKYLKYYNMDVSFDDDFFKKSLRAFISSVSFDDDFLKKALSAFMSEEKLQSIYNKNVKSDKNS